MKVPGGTDGIYHCCSRIVGGDYIFKHAETTKFIHLMWHIGDFLGIQILDHSVMSNHYLRFRGAMAKGDKSTHLLRPKYTKRMANPSEFKKILKQRFSTWYNKQKSRKGT